MITIDRFEENIAICFDENDEKIEIDLLFLPVDVREGDLLYFENGIYKIDIEKTAQKRAKIKKLQDKLFGK